MSADRPKGKSGGKAGGLLGDEGNGLTMSDVAREAGVATSTVSRALANPGRVNERTRARILDAVARLGYTPNAAARNLRIGTSRMVMIVLPDQLTTGQIVPEVLRSIDAELVESRYSIIIGNLDRLTRTEDHILDLAFGGLVDGALVLSSAVPATAGRSMLDAGVPVVSLLFDHSPSGVASVVTNDREAMFDVTDHLVRLGHRSFFYIGGPAGNYHEIERFAGLNEGLVRAAAGVSVRHFGGDFFAASGKRAAAEYLSLKERPTAVVSCNDDMAIGFMNGIRAAGLRIPEDFSIVGFDGTEKSEYSNPMLTTMRQPIAEIGAKGARLLLDLLETRSAQAQRIVCPSELVIRETTGPARGAAPCR